MTLEQLLADLERRAVEAEAIGASAPVANVLRGVAEDLRGLDLAPACSARGDRLLTVAEAALILGVTDRWLYDHAARLPFKRKLGRKCLRFSEAGLRRWVALRPAA